MSYDDEDHRPTRGAYTPPTDDDLPFNNRRAYDARRGGGGSPPPWTLIISGGVLLLLVIVVLAFYGLGGMRASEDAPLIGEPVGDLKVEAPVEAQPIDPAEGVSLYEDAPTTETPQFAPPPETVQPRPVTAAPLPPAKTTPAPATPATPPAKAQPAAPAPAAPASAGGSAAVQIGAFSSTERADRAYSEVAAAFPSFMSGRGKRVTETTNASGTTLYRTVVTGFSAADARAFCDALKAANRQCSVQ